MAQRFAEYDNKIQAVCFTGHRSIDVSAAHLLPVALKGAILEAIGRGARRFMTGGAMGFDTIAALCVLELREQYPEITLELILPCRNQTQRWDALNRAIYNAILERADRVEYMHETYTAGCMHDRNRRLVDLSDLVITYFVHGGGGTAYTVAYALTQGRELINIDDKISKG